ncbi:hypothetical protein GGH12_004500 [Coemansia sp. RSA 1822]|nr:hypothetical protein LPJ76_004435 [Coemansia sp. RSA 638]KAJ2119822.1 hypothetical protein IW147_005555 [Coemansia sp. RSA 720]KAJ2540632.1 hypothetical protein GGF49_004295 [Coemansia sp. RSA 1853]KAJ2560805.1 hypothetical protein GGH12_004500 [Coemansia sp. RSA 1822]
MAVLGDPSDEGFDDCFPLRTPPSSASKPKAVKPSTVLAAESQAMESLAQVLQKSATPQACTHLALALLARVPAAMLRLAMQELDRRLRRDFVDVLPMDISLRIFEFLPAVDVARNVALVSRQWYAVATQPHLWQRQFRAQGWRLDGERWKMYCSFSCIADTDRALLHRSATQIASAFTTASPGTLAPAIASRRSMYALHREFASLYALEADGSPLMGSLAAALTLPVPWRAPSPESSSSSPRTCIIRDPASLGRFSGPNRHVRFCMSSSSYPPQPQPLARNLQHLHSLPARRQSKPVDWRGVYAEHHQLLANWREGRCRVDRWESAHPESIYCVQFGRDNRVYTGSRDHTVRLWHLSETGSQITQLATLAGHTGSVLTLQADDTTLVTGSSDATACVWDLATCTVRRRLQHADAVLSLRFSDKWLVTASKDRMLHVWRRDCDYAHAFALPGHAVAINAISLHGDMLVSASGDRTIKLWDLATRTCVHTLDEHTRGVATLDFDGIHIVSGSSDRSIRIWNALTGVCERTIANAHADLVRTVAFSRAMDVVVSGSYDETIKVWSFSTGALIHKFRNVHTSRVFKLMFDRTRIVSCSHDRSVSIIDFAADLPRARLLL